MALFLLLVTTVESTSPVSGRVFDAVTRQPIAGATVTTDGVVMTTDASGNFKSEEHGSRLTARAIGYLRASRPLLAPYVTDQLRVELTPFTPKALYLSGYGAASKDLREAALRLVAETELNALVIDVKGDWGQISYPSAIPLATQIGAQKVLPLKDIRRLVDNLKAKGIYLIARIVVFKDDPLGRVRPDLCVRKADGTVYRDREGLAWVDPFSREVWNYNIGVAEEAARLGFDEIQFDYVRFPDHPGLRFSQPATEASRVAAVGGFLAAARKRLENYNVFLASDIFGYVCWNLNDTGIGQRFPEISDHVDYLSPMLYPSGFQFGIPGYQNPVEHPYQVVNLTLERARQRTGLPKLRFRPWLQSFRDYAFDHRPFVGQPLRDQIDAAESFGTNGWMLWNPNNVYPRDGLKLD